MALAAPFGSTPSEFAHGVRLLVTGTRELLDEALADMGAAGNKATDRIETVSAFLAVLEEKALALAALCEEAEARARANVAGVRSTDPYVPRGPR